MNTEKNNYSALLGVALAGAITVTQTNGKFDLWDSMLGLVLLSILIAFDDYKGDSRKIRFAHSNVWSLCTILCIGIFLDLLIAEKMICGFKISGREYNGLILLIWMLISYAWYWYLYNKNTKSNQMTKEKT